MGIVGLLFLIISLLQSEQALLRAYGLISCLFMLAAYYDDLVLVVTNLAIILCHYKWLYVSGNGWREVNKLFSTQLDDFLY
jgi:hypothetical protein